jgi:CubicO group peptidase (beta-lactamase class C family)
MAQAQVSGALKETTPMPAKSLISTENLRRRTNVEQGLLVQPGLDSHDFQKADLLARMKFYNVPSASIAVINDFKIDWAQGYGVREAGTDDPVTTETLFEVCSISKAVTAIAVLRLVQQGRLNLDEDVNKYLVSWKIPSNGSWQPRVTLRQLLTHTAGLEHGVPGYSIDAPFPTLPQVLNGDPPAITLPVRVTTLPGTQYRYSSDGYTVVQQLLIDVEGKPFSQLMKDLVFAPLGMEHSTFEQPLPRSLWNSAAAGHRTLAPYSNPDKWQVFPEMAASGLWSTASDLARLVLELQLSKAGKSNKLLSTATVQQMFTKQTSDSNIGLGIYIDDEGANMRFSHTGAQLGWNAEMLGYVENGRGAVILLNNGYTGGLLKPEIKRAIAVEYGWPNFIPQKRTPAAVTPESLAGYIGTYEFPTGSMQITRPADLLLFQYAGQEPIELHPKSDAEFYAESINAEVSFVKSTDGKTSELKLRQKGKTIIGKKQE